MSTLDSDLDEQVAAAERRIEQRRRRVLADTRLLKRAARRELTSPPALLFAAGVGFALGRITERARAPGQTRLSRIAASIASATKAALSVVQTPSVVWLARWFGTERSAHEDAQTSVADERRERYSLPYVGP
jgi:hypothetical protein